MNYTIQPHGHTTIAQPWVLRKCWIWCECSQMQKWKCRKRKKNTENVENMKEIFAFVYKISFPCINLCVTFPHFMNCGCWNAPYTHRRAPWEPENLFLSIFSKYNLKTDVAALGRKDSELSGAILANRGHVLQWEPDWAHHWALNLTVGELLCGGGLVWWEALLRSLTSHATCGAPETAGLASVCRCNTGVNIIIEGGLQRAEHSSSSADHFVFFSW